MTRNPLSMDMLSFLKKMVKDPDKHIEKALAVENTLEIEDIFVLEDDIIDSLEYTESGVKFGLTKFEKQQVRSVREYQGEMLVQDKDINDLSIYDTNDLQKWKNEKRQNAVMSSTSSSKTSASSTAPDPNKEKLMEWNCHKRLELSSYEVIKHDHDFERLMEQNRTKAEYDQWDCVLELDTTIFDPSNIVADLDDARLYDKQKNYAKIVLEKIFQSAKGKEFLCDNKKDIVKGYKEYKAYIQSSLITEEHFHDELASIFAIPVEKHKGTLQSYIDGMDISFKEHNEQYPNGISEHLMTSVLKHNVSNNDTLKVIWDQQIWINQGLTPPGIKVTVSYEHNKGALVVAAQRDDKNKVKQRGTQMINFCKYLMAGMSKNYESHQANFENQINQPDSNGYYDTDELYHHQVNVNHAISHRRGRPKLNPLTFLDRDIFLGNNALYKECIKGTNTQRMSIRTSLAEISVPKSNRELEVIAADTTSATNQDAREYYVQFVDAVEEINDLPPEPNTPNPETVVAKTSKFSEEEIYGYTQKQCSTRKSCLILSKQEIHDD